MIGALFETNIKYELLTSLLEDTLNNIRYSNNVNVIIDLKSIYKKAYRTDLNNIISDQKIAIEDITAHVLNMIGHYRNFLYKAGKYSTFYVLYSKSECKKLQAICPDYKKYYYDKYFNNTDEFKNMNNICKSVTKQLEILCKYIPNVYFVDTSEFDEFIYANYLIRHVIAVNDINLLLTTDPVMYQVLNSTSFALDLKGNQSTVLTEKNVIKYLTKTDTNISVNLLNVMLSICGCDEYSIEKIPGYGYKKALKIVKSLNDQQLLLDKTYLNCPTSILVHDPVLSENISMIQKNYNAIFPVDIQFLNQIVLSTAFIISKPKVTMKQFKELNERIFLFYPLNLSSLLKGESVL